jgi:hypothetical protein
MRGRARSPGTRSNRIGSGIDPPRRCPMIFSAGSGRSFPIPINPLIERIPMAGVVEKNQFICHNSK